MAKHQQEAGELEFFVNVSLKIKLQNKINYNIKHNIVSACLNKNMTKKITNFNIELLIHSADGRHSCTD